MNNQQVLYLGAGLAGANRFSGRYDHVQFWDYPADESTFAALSNVTPSTLAGDYMADGSVDAADYILWRKAQGQTVTPGTSADGTGNGIIDADDHSLWSSNFGRTLPAAAAASISKPTNAALPESSSASVASHLPFDNVRLTDMRTPATQMQPGNTPAVSTLRSTSPMMLRSHVDDALLAMIAARRVSPCSRSDDSQTMTAIPDGDGPTTSSDFVGESATLFDQLAHDRAIRTKIHLLTSPLIF
jgi:hypothetical protein